jgi:hypothetical protein
MRQRVFGAGALAAGLLLLFVAGTASAQVERVVVKIEEARCFS